MNIFKVGDEVKFGDIFGKVISITDKHLTVKDHKNGDKYYFVKEEENYRSGGRMLLKNNKQPEYQEMTINIPISLLMEIYAEVIVLELGVPTISGRIIELVRNGK